MHSQLSRLSLSPSVKTITDDPAQTSCLTIIPAPTAAKRHTLESESIEDSGLLSHLDQRNLLKQRCNETFQHL